MNKLIILGLFTLFCQNIFAQDLVYQPKNPAFGGNTFNYQWMLSSAESQNTFTEETSSLNSRNQSDIERFTENLNNQLLSQLSRSLFNEQFGEGITEGTYTFGTLFVEVFPSNEGLVISILDTNTGDQTQVVVPN